MYNNRNNHRPASEQDNQKISHHAIKLPKGGGAISGMGETFQANAATGTGNFSVPLPVTSGRDEFAPDLVLSYNSGSGNTPFGLGWDIGLPAITRSTDKQLPTYNDAENKDTFVLSGAEDLVPVLEQENGQWIKNGGERFTAPILGMPEDNYKITRYRPRIEGLFARIEKWKNTSDGQVHWQATTKDNITSYYGLTNQARIYDCREQACLFPTKVFSWLLEKTINAKGSSIDYEYKQENSDNILSDITEYQRLSKGFAFNQKYLKRIKYAPMSNDPTKHHLQLVLDYGEHTSDTPDETTTWAKRQDPYSNYKPGFEVRSYRLCQRVLMFHNFPATVSDDWQLVKSLELNYEQKPTMTYLSSVIQKGYKRNATGYETKAMPAMEFGYTQPEIDTTMRKVDNESKRNLPIGLDHNSYQWVDLKGEGLSGVMSFQAGRLFYKENLGDGQLGELAEFRELPQPLQEPIQVTDINGDGNQEVVIRSNYSSGYFELKDEKWQQYIPFEKNPTIDLNDPNTRMIDLTGDGKPDVLITQADKLVWLESEGEKGYALPDAGASGPSPLHEGKDSRIVFADSTGSIHLADMSGDGLTDVVRIQNGSVCYWPNLGYGNFGPKVEMTNAPRFTIDQRKFNAANIQLGDVDGSGSTDIFYFGNEQVEYWLNESGNSFSEKQTLSFCLPVDSFTTISLIDFTAKGTMSLVWSSKRPGQKQYQLSYMDLMTRKPHLLSEVNNNMGKLVKLSYASSSKYYLEDKKSGKPWVTKLPFPVHVLNQVETIDQISGSKLVTEYKYHHGFYDTFEREFRGFGMVETVDTETFEEYSGDPQNYVKPVLTKTWFHNGAYVRQDKISKQYETEYYTGDAEAFLLPDTVIENSDDLDAASLRQAYRALKGSTLRKEVYEVGNPTPYQVTEANFNIKTIQPVACGNKHAVFFPHSHETMTFHYEQQLEDPRISHEFALEVDDYGNTIQTASIVYPRRAVAEATTEQLKAYATLQINEVINITTDYSSPLQGEDRGEGVHLIGISYESRSYELAGITITATTAVNFDTLKTEVVASLLNSQTKLFDWSRQYYWNAAQTDKLPLGQITDKALLHHTEAASLADDVLVDVYNNQLTTTDLTAAGYVLADGYYWNPGLVQHYKNGYFYLPFKTVDAFGNEVVVTYDDFNFMPIKIEDALGNISEATIDYRTLQPWQLIDPNGNKSEAITDPMGMVIATSSYGEELAVIKGDTPLFAANGDANYIVQTDATIANVLADPAKYLQEATTFFYYDLEAFANRQEPPQSILIARETHVSELGTGETTNYQKTIAYSDGFGRELQTKLMVEPGRAWVKQADDSYLEQTVATRWLSSGRTVYNNKEKPVKQYEPFYIDTHNYSSEAFFAEYGVTPVLHYDPLLRVIRTDTPKGFFTKVEFTPWQVATFDENDTVLDSDFYSGYSSPSGGEDQGEGEALQKAALHYNTPQVSLLDTLGREYKTIEYLVDKNAATVSDELVTYSTFNIKGKPLTITDPRQLADATGVKTFEYTYDMQDQVIRTINIDSGDDRVLANVMGNPVHAFDSKGHHITMSYDALHRPVKTQVTGNGLNNTTEQLIYGEGLADAVARNMRGQLYQHYDQAGLKEVERYTFKSEPVISTQSVREEYKTEANWIDGNDWSLLLDATQYTTTTSYDALGRVTSQDNPDTSNVQPEYHQSGKLNKVNVKLKGETTHQEFVSSITYNPKGQREEITYGNNTKTVYGYEATTFRLSSLITTRLSDNQDLQDLSYTYDPVGNITKMRDDSYDRVFNNNQVVEPEQDYIYDTLYRLLEANGREHMGINVPDYYKNSSSFKQSTFINRVDANDANKLANYTRNFQYDKAGNLTQIQHVGTNNFTRTIGIDSTTNKMTPTTDFDNNGNLTQLENIAALGWNYRDNISKAVIIERPSEIDDAEYYVYDSQGQRVRKVKETFISATVTEIEEKIYLGGVEIKRIYQNTTPLLERTSLHVMDDQKRLAIAHNWSQDDQLRELDSASEIGTNKVRYQFENHLGSASLELDTTGLVISYEEYYPYGGTSFIAGTNQKEVKLKEYRYSAKERDDTTGLYYYGARYYAPWLGRWMSADPKGQEGSGLNMYWYTSGNPINRIDPDGMADRNIIQYGMDKYNEVQDRYTAVGNELKEMREKGIKQYVHENRHETGLMNEIIYRDFYKGESSAAGVTINAITGIFPTSDVQDAAAAGVDIYKDPTSWKGYVALSLVVGATMFPLLGDAIKGLVKGVSKLMGKAGGEVVEGAVEQISKATVKKIDDAAKIVFRDAKSIRYSQNSIKTSFGKHPYGKIDELITGLRKGTIKPEDVEPIRLVEREGKLISIDNRRLYAFREAGVEVPTKMATPKDIALANKSGRFSAGRLGADNIRLRGVKK